MFVLKCYSIFQTKTSESLDLILFITRKKRYFPDSDMKFHYSCVKGSCEKSFFFVDVFLWVRRAVMIFCRTQETIGVPFRYLEHARKVNRKISNGIWKQSWPYDTPMKKYLRKLNKKLICYDFSWHDCKCGRTRGFCGRGRGFCGRTRCFGTVTHESDEKLLLRCFIML